MNVALTRSRLRNALRGYWSYALSRFGLVRIQHGPLFVSVEPANICQLRCPECPVGSKGERLKVKGERLMPRAVWERVLEQIKPCAHTIQFYFQGEPLLHKDLPQMIVEAHEAGLYTIVSTNAQAMTYEMAEALVGAGLNRIIVSMDGLTEASYSVYRVGGKLDQCKAALRWLRQSKIKHQTSNIIIELQCLRLRTNEHEWTEFKKQYKALGADRLVFKTAQEPGTFLLDHDSIHEESCEAKSNNTLLCNDSDAGAFAEKILSYSPDMAIAVTFWEPPFDWHSIKDALVAEILKEHGVKVLCHPLETAADCYDKAHTHAFGNIMEQPLQALFCNDKANAFRRAAMNQQPQICQECYK